MSFQSLFGTFEHQNDGGARSQHDQRQRAKLMADKMKKMSAQIERRQRIVKSIESELTPLVVRYQQLARTRPSEAAKLKPKMTELGKRLAKEEHELRIDEKLIRLGEMTQDKTTHTDVRGEYLNMLKMTTPHVARTADGVVNADSIIGDLAQAHLDSASDTGTLAESLSQNLSLLDLDSAVDVANGRATQEADAGAGADGMLDTLLDRFGTHEEVFEPTRASATVSQSPPVYKPASDMVDIALDLSPPPPRTAPNNTPMRARTQAVALSIGANKKTSFTTFDDDD